MVASRARSSLDLFSTSQTSECSSSVTCAYSAPYFAYQKEGKIYGLLQGCCNHWDCPRCGVYRAKSEYGRIVHGCEKLSETRALYFITVTCRGAELSLQDAEQNYLRWTNRFFTACRTKAKREGQDWCYVQVTEKQKRGHPHSHILTTFCPNDICEGVKANWVRCNGVLACEWIPCLRSSWLQEQSIRSGLGSEYDVSRVKTAAAASRYVAKYMFKDSMFGTHFPKGWKRVRYSQNFPKLPVRKTDAFVLLSRADWQKLAGLAACIVCDSVHTQEEALHNLRGHDILIG